MKNINQIPFTTLFAFGSFAFGTIFFISYMKFQNENILLFGFLYVLAAIFFNLIILINLISQLLTIRGERANTFIKILIVLSNIPIALTYLIILNNKQLF
ncbi:hypothetical protein [Flavobacterium sp.]|uniref:hypothetical protein n=1 Tax=Flavobacterium sp. TaxID=239 RepID=UPI0037515CA1